MLTNAKAELERDGVTVLPRVVPELTIDEVRQALDDNRRLDRPRSRQILYTHDGPRPERPPFSVLMDQWLNPFRYDGPGSTARAAETLRPIAASLLGAAPVLFQDLLLLKRPGQREFPWHQDFCFWPVDRPDAVILWVPLQSTTPESGALRFAVGSHRLGPRPAVDLHDGRPQDPDRELGFQPGDWPQLVPTYSCGDAVAFSPLTFHASPAMTRPIERAAWSCVFLDPAVRWRHANAPTHPICKTIEDGAPVSEARHA